MSAGWALRWSPSVPLPATQGILPPKVASPRRARAQQRSGFANGPLRLVVLAAVATAADARANIKSGDAFDAADGGGPAILELESFGASKGKPRKFGGILAEWSAPEGRVFGTPLVKSEPDPYGCSKVRKCRGCAIFVQQGQCTFAQKAKIAEAAGASLLVVASAKEGSPVGMSAEAVRTKRLAPKITAIMISKNSGRQVLLALDRGEEFVASCQKVNAGYADLVSEVFVGMLAVSLVMLGAWHSVEDLRLPATKERFLEEVFAVEEHSGYHFVLFGSVMLTVLFFFMKYLVYVLVFLFATGAISTTTVLLEPLIAERAPNLAARRACTVPKWVANMFGVAEEHSCSDLIAEVVGGALALGFVIFRNNASYGWLFQNTIAVMLLLTIQRTLRLPNLRVGTLLLICTFFFDIFWVFISPLIFKKSVMIEVATGGNSGQSVPMVLKIPAFTGLPGQFKILGLGDIAIPGLLISLLLRHDLTQRASRCSGYFVAGVIGYALGLVATFVSLYLMKHGQPALLFLVPGTLLPTFTIAWRKGELVSLWSANYGPPQHPPEGYEQLDDGADKRA